VILAWPSRPARGKHERIDTPPIFSQLEAGHVGDGDLDAGHPDWRWRISDYAGTTLEAPEVSFATIAAAVAAGRRRLRTFGLLDGADVAAGRRHYSWGAARRA